MRKKDKDIIFSMEPLVSWAFRMAEARLRPPWRVTMSHPDGSVFETTYGPEGFANTDIIITHPPVNVMVKDLLPIDITFTGSDGAKVVVNVTCNGRELVARPEFRSWKACRAGAGARIARRRRRRW